MATLSRLYDDYETATVAVRALETAGVPSGDISIVSSNADGRYTTTPANRVDADRDGVDDRAEGAGAGAGVGAVVGGAAGLLTGLGMIAIPGVGPVVAAGWLAATLAGAAAGGAAGGIIGALSEAGIEESDAPVYAEGLRRGGAIVTVRVVDADRVRVENLLDRSAVNMRDRAANYRSAGWTGFDPADTTYVSERDRNFQSRSRIP